MHHGTRNARDNWNAVTDPTPSALAGSVLVIGLGPIVGSYLAGHPALGGGLLLGIGLSYLLVRLSRWEGNTHEPDNAGQLSEIPIWFDPLYESRSITADPASD